MFLGKKMENKGYNNYWQGFISGNSAAFRMLYDAHADKLFSFGCLFVADEELVKDCIHDLFVDLDRYRAKLNPHVNVSAYLISSLKRKILTAKRHNRPHTGFDDVSVSMVLTEDRNAETSLIHSEEEKAILKRLMMELEKLPARQQEALHLKFNAELSYDEIAEIMAVSVPTCRTLVYRAIRQLRLQMEGQPIGNLLLLLFAGVTKR